MNDLFHSARLRLTALQLLIIMSISMTFSVVIYQRFSSEISRIYRSQEARRDIMVQLNRQDRAELFEFDPAVFQEARERTIANLFVINGIIFIVAGGLGYALAGKILEPINEALEEQSRFTADASHELRTPLTALKTEVEVSLRDKHLTLQEARALLASNLEEINKLRSLSDALLLLARHTDKKALSTFSEVSMSTTIQDAISNVQPLADQKQIRIEYQKSAEGAIVRGDKAALVNLFVILLDNAIKYSPEQSSVTLSVRMRDKQVSVQVQDRGIGMSKEELTHIFDRFYRADRARTKQDAGGYGLGLSIAQHIVEQHMGKISVKSASDQGTTFIVVLPVSARR